MCNTYTNEHYWVIGSNTSKVSMPIVGQPCQCGAVRWVAAQQGVQSDGAKCPEGQHNWSNSLECSKCGELQF